MDEQKQSLETLQDIKRMMERSSRFISLSGLSGISAGICALIGAWFSVDYVYGRKDYIIDQDAAIAQVAANDYSIIFNITLFWIAAITFRCGFNFCFYFHLVKK
ncbi:MAG: hypothetical protein V9E88_07030 [Ferruginibacter sp.]